MKKKTGQMPKLCYNKIRVKIFFNTLYLFGGMKNVRDL